LTSDLTSEPASDLVSQSEPAPGVSVVIATRDRYELVREAVAAILAQEYHGPLEVVVVFDQSPVDETLAREQADRIVRVISNNHPPGLAGARNAGAETTVHPLLAFCDDDDVWLPTKLRKQVDELRRTGLRTCVTGIEIDHRNHLTRRVPQARDLRLGPLLRKRVVAAHPSSVLVERSAFFGEIGLVDEKIPGSYGEDYDWLLRAVKVGPIALVAEPLVRVRWGGQSYFSDRWQTIIDANDYLLGKHPEFSEEPVALARLLGRKSIALVALSRRREAISTAVQALRLNPRDIRGLLGLVLVTGVLTPAQALRAANRMGRGL
jgi:glycosyltransferase involved in cell wall biosynthesis